MALSLIDAALEDLKLAQVLRLNRFILNENLQFMETKTMKLSQLISLGLACEDQQLRCLVSSWVILLARDQNLWTLIRKTTLPERITLCLLEVPTKENFNTQLNLLLALRQSSSIPFNSDDVHSILASIQFSNEFSSLLIKIRD